MFPGALLFSALTIPPEVIGTPIMVIDWKCDMNFTTSKYLTINMITLELFLQAIKRSMLLVHDTGVQV